MNESNNNSSNDNIFSNNNSASGYNKNKKLIWSLVILTALAFVGFTLRSFYSVPRVSQVPAVTMRILTYNQFKGSFGPGPSLARAFEKDCNCKVEFISANGANLLLEKLKLMGKPIDLVVGMDLFSMEKSPSRDQWEKVNTEDIHFLPEIKDLVTPEWVPFDWSPLTLFTRKNILQETLASNAYKQGQDEYEYIVDLKKMLASPQQFKKIAFQDPRTSTPGLHALLWLYPYFSVLKPWVHSFSSSWTTSYGLFQKKQVDFVFSYQSSIWYHLYEEKTKDVVYLSSPEGHPFQVEFMGVPKTCQNCQLAKKFLRFVLSTDAQEFLMKKNYMYPVIAFSSFDHLTSDLDWLKRKPLQRLPLQKYKEFSQRKSFYLDEWKKAFLSEGGE